MVEVPHDAEEEERTTVRIRRAPRYSTFIIVGGLVGFLVTLVLTSLFPADPAVGFAATFGYFALFGVPIGAALAALLAIVLDRRATRHATEVVAGKLEVLAVDGQLQDEDTPVSTTALDQNTAVKNTAAKNTAVGDAVTDDTPEQGNR